jgi:hypothetical protein
MSNQFWNALMAVLAFGSGGVNRVLVRLSGFIVGAVSAFAAPSIV